MDIENFMVNDWASLYKNDKLIGIEKLTKQTFFNALNSNATINLEPIRLTEELFMLNGWEKDGPYLNYKIDEFSTLTYYSYEHRLSCTWKGPDELENNAIVADKTLIIQGLKYVHELQQALRLHGLNKIANNIECLFFRYNKSSMKRKKYIRFKPLPPSGKSSIYSHGNKIGEEIGISVFDAVNINDTWHIVMPMPITQNMLDDIYSLLNYSNEGIYLVEGEQIGTGTDNEPLIKDAVVLKEISMMFRPLNKKK